jgi:2-oxo-3-hexenedioate decarboxylase
VKSDTDDPADDALARRLLDAADRVSLMRAPSDDDPTFDLPRAWRVADRMRRLRIDERGVQPRGYKIGFTNRRIWPIYGVHAPIWSPVYAHTLEVLDGVDACINPSAFAQPRLEPEIVFAFAAAPTTGMGLDALARCIDWVAHGVEIVHTHFADWRFRAPDTVADGGLHGRLLVGPRVPAARFDDLAAELRALSIELERDGEVVDRGDGAAVLGGPLDALRQWLDAMASTTPQWTVRAGDVVTTGTLTDAWPLAPGQRWRTHTSDARLAGLTLECAPR